MKKILLLAIGAGVLSGCVAPTPMLISGEPGDPPPQIVFMGARDAQGDDYLTWRNVRSFGEVPESLKAMGDLSCMQFDIQLRATGFHPAARDRAGVPILGGGFYCSPLSSADAQAPQLVSVDGQLTWDRPGAFGVVPAELLKQGSEICGASDTGGYALGYRSDALNIDGTPLPEGGFLCGNKLSQFNAAESAVRK